MSIKCNNKNSKGESNPVEIHIFELNGLEKFIAINYIDLLKNAKNALGGSLLNVHQRVISPNAELQLTFKYSKSVDLGFVFNFREGNIEKSKITVFYSYLLKPTKIMQT